APPEGAGKHMGPDGGLQETPWWEWAATAAATAGADFRQVAGLTIWRCESRDTRAWGLAKGSPSASQVRPASVQSIR
ncbi:MAG: hypothetical protein ACRD0J_17255, partial [Acidimicrobiales bacterium]